jgi:hypothetical protein
MLRSENRLWRAVLVCLLLAPAAACNGDDDGAVDDGGSGSCLAPLSLECRPSFEPADFEQIFENVLRPSCGSSASGTQCHGAEGRQAGLVLADRDEAYASLLGEDDGRPRVIPGDPECSMLIQRIETSDRRLRMPLNSDPLSEGQRCAIRLWIAEGAEP